MWCWLGVRAQKPENRLLKMKITTKTATETKTRKTGYILMRGLLCKHHKMTKTNQNHKTENPNGPAPLFFHPTSAGGDGGLKKTLAVSQFDTLPEGLYHRRCSNWMIQWQISEGFIYSRVTFFLVLSSRGWNGAGGSIDLGTRMNVFLSEFERAHITSRKITIHTAFLPVLHHFHDYFG